MRWNMKKNGTKRNKVNRKKKLVLLVPLERRCGSTIQKKQTIEAKPQENTLKKQYYNMDITKERKKRTGKLTHDESTRSS